jgi:hypothetical protein
MSIDSQAGTPETFPTDLLGPPPLMQGEDASRYWRLHNAIEYHNKPKTIFDWIRVREIADKQWQQQRCKQGGASFVESAYLDALASLLRPFYAQPIVLIGEDAAFVTARKYYGGEMNAKEREDIDSLLAQYRITQEQIRAKAMQLCSGALTTFYRMENHCETSLRMLRRE